MKVMYTGPRDIHVSPALERARFSTSKIQSEELIVDWNDVEDSNTEKYKEHHFREKKSIFAVIRWQLFLLRETISYKPDLIFNMSVLSFIPLFIYSLFFKTKIIYDCRDYLAVSYDFSYLLSTLIRFFDNISALHASAIIIPDEYGYEYFNMPSKSKIHVVYNSVKDYGYRKEKTDGAIRLAYFGYLSLDRNINAIFDFFETTDLDIELHIACNYVPDSLRDVIPDSPRIFFYERKTHQEAQKLLSNMDYCFMTYNPDLGVYKNIQPTKFYDCLAIGLPYICSKGMRNLEKHVDFSSNIAIEYGSIDFNGIEKTEFSEYNHQIYIEKYVYENICDDFRSFIEKVVRDF